MEVVIKYDGQLLAGVDEAGRGPLMGPVIAAAVILDPQKEIVGLNDSKKISEKKRQQLYQEIKEKAQAYAIGRAEVEEIDKLNILQASLLAMKRAILKLPIKAEFAAIDGNRCPSIDLPMQAIIKGDSLVPAISAASIIAKVTRDTEMLAFDSQFPQYGIASHKGYPTKLHLRAIEEYGITPLHRRSFGPVARIIKRDISKAF